MLFERVPGELAEIRIVRGRLEQHVVQRPIGFVVLVVRDRSRPATARLKFIVAAIDHDRVRVLRQAFEPADCLREVQAPLGPDVDIHPPAQRLLELPAHDVTDRKPGMIRLALGTRFAHDHKAQRFVCLRVWYSGGRPAGDNLGREFDAFRRRGVRERVPGTSVQDRRAHFQYRRAEQAGGAEQKHATSRGGGLLSAPGSLNAPY